MRRGNSHSRRISRSQQLKQQLQQQEARVTAEAGLSYSSRGSSHMGRSNRHSGRGRDHSSRSNSHSSRGSQSHTAAEAAVKQRQRQQSQQQRQQSQQQEAKITLQRNNSHGSNFEVTVSRKQFVSIGNSLCGSGSSHGSRVTVTAGQAIKLQSQQSTSARATVH